MSGAEAARGAPPPRAACRPRAASPDEAREPCKEPERVGPRHTAPQAHWGDARRREREEPRRRVARRIERRVTPNLRDAHPAQPADEAHRPAAPRREAHRAAQRVAGGVVALAQRRLRVAQRRLRVDLVREGRAWRAEGDGGAAVDQRLPHREPRHRHARGGGKNRPQNLESSQVSRSVCGFADWRDFIVRRVQERAQSFHREEVARARTGPQPTTPSYQSSYT
eukprot:gene11927-biopygen2995